MLTATVIERLRVLSVTRLVFCNGVVYVRATYLGVSAQLEDEGNTRDDVLRELAYKLMMIQTQLSEVGL